LRTNPTVDLYGLLDLQGIERAAVQTLPAFTFVETQTQAAGWICLNTLGMGIMILHLA